MAKLAAHAQVVPAVKLVVVVLLIVVELLVVVVLLIVVELHTLRHSPTSAMAPMLMKTNACSSTLTVCKTT